MTVMTFHQRPRRSRPSTIFIITITYLVVIFSILHTLCSSDFDETFPSDSSLSVHTEVTGSSIGESPSVEQLESTPSVTPSPHDSSPIESSESSLPQGDVISSEQAVTSKRTLKKIWSCTKDKGYKYRPGAFVARESQLAHELLDNYCGIEIGPGACNPFGLNTLHVGLTEEMDPIDYFMFGRGQIESCGDYAKIDVPGDAMNLSYFLNSSVPFILHSHVWEHVPNPLKALEEWVRVVQGYGIIFIMVPYRCALETDCTRNVTTIQDLIYYYEIDATLDDFINEETGRLPGRKIEGNTHRDHHLIIFTPDLLIQIMRWFNQKYYDQHISLQLISFLFKDDKYGNGHQIAWQVIKNENRPKEEIAMR